MTKTPSVQPHPLHRFALAVESRFDKLKHAVSVRLRGDPSRYVVAYDGYANAREAWIGGRMHYGKPPSEASADDSTFDNLQRAWHRWETDEIPHAKLQVKAFGRLIDLEADEEGYFFAQLDLEQPPDPTTLWHDIEITLTHDPNRRGQTDVTPPAHAKDDPRRATAGIVQPPHQASVLILSDVDDTVLHTDVTRAWSAAKMTIFDNAFGRTALPGAAALYQALVRGPQPEQPETFNPVFYISSSAWNLYRAIRRFIEIKNLPAGPILLRDLGLDQNNFLKSDHSHKLEKVHRVAAMYPEVPLVLIGDSGQEDANLYAQAAEDLGAQRIKLILIRDVNPAHASEHDEKVRRAMVRTEALGVSMHLVADSAQAAAHALAAGLIHPDAVDAIVHATQHAS